MTIAIEFKTNWKRKLNETKLIEINRLLRSKILKCAIKNKNKTRQGLNKKTGEKLTGKIRKEPIKQSRMYYSYFWLILHLWLEWAYQNNSFEVSKRNVRTIFDMILQRRWNINIIEIKKLYSRAFPLLYIYARNLLMTSAHARAPIHPSVQNSREGLTRFCKGGEEEP